MFLNWSNTRVYIHVACVAGVQKRYRIGKKRKKEGDWGLLSRFSPSPVPLRFLRLPRRLHTRKSRASIQEKLRHCERRESKPVMNMVLHFKPRMLITRLICIQCKSDTSRFLSPASTVSAGNTRDHDSPYGAHTSKKKETLVESRY